MPFPEQVIGQLSAPNTPFLSYPRDLQNVPFVCALRFTKYQRETSIETGNNKTTGTIVLPLPNELVESYGINHSDKQFPIFGLMLALTNARQNGGYEELFSNPAFAAAISSMAGGFMSGQGGGDGLIALAGRAATAVGDLLQSTTGNLLNPHATVLFTGVALREFTYTWSISPRNYQESKDIQKILILIRQKALPKAKSGGAFLEYPEEVQLDFLGNGIENFVFGTKRTVITKFYVDSNPEKTHPFYKTGAPVRINFGITLKEVAIRTSEDYGVVSGNPRSRGQP